MDERTELAAYSISLEELAMALGLVNAPDLSHRLLASVYADQAPELNEARLTSAAHALLARALCHLTPEDTLQLEPAFEQALYPLVKYKSFIKVSMRVSGIPAQYTVSLGKESFTSRVIVSGVVQVLTHGPIQKLPEHLAELIETAGEGGGARELNAGLTPAQIQAMTGKEPEENAKQLVAFGWPAKDADLLVQDLAVPLLVANLVHIRADEKYPEEKLSEAKKKALLLLRGEQNTWAFQFPGTDDEVKGSVHLVDRKAFVKILAALIA